MSWSFSGIGKPPAVAKKMEEDLARYNCVEPEESFRKKVVALTSEILASFAPTMAVRVEASGSQWSNNGEPAANTLSLKIEPLYGFIE